MVIFCSRFVHLGVLQLPFVSKVGVFSTRLSRLSRLFSGQNNTGVLPETAFEAVNAIGAVVDVTEMVKKKRMVKWGKDLLRKMLFLVW